MSVFAVADRFLQRACVDVLKRSMSISQAKLDVSGGPESLSIISSSDTFLQQESDVLLTSSGSTMSGNVDELEMEKDKVGGDVDVELKTVSNEVDQPAGCDVSSECAAQHDPDSSGCDVSSSECAIQNDPASAGCDVSTSECAIQHDPASATDVMSDEQLSGAGDGSYPVNLGDIAGTKVSDSGSAVSNAQDDVATDNCDQTADSEPQCHSEDQSPPQTADDEHTADMNLSEAAGQRTDHDVGNNSSNDGDSADRSSEFEYIADPDHDTSTRAEQSAAADSTDDMSVVHIEPDTSAEEAVVTVLVRDIPRGLEETVEMYLESTKKGGGKIVSFDYNRQNGSALVVFADNEGELAYVMLIELSVTESVLAGYVMSWADLRGQGGHGPRRCQKSPLFPT